MVLNPWSLKNHEFEIPAATLSPPPTNENDPFLVASTTDNEKFTSSLQGLRTQIDDLDSELLEVLKRRMNVAEQKKKNKKENGVTILQTDRWSKILENRIKIGGKYNLSEEFMIKLLKAIHQESINRQTKVMNDK